MASETIWIIGGCIAAFVLLVKIFEQFTRRKLDDKLVLAIRDHDKEFIAELSKHSRQAESRAAAIVAVLESLRSISNINNKIISKHYELVISDRGWGQKLDTIKENTRGVGNNKVLLNEIRNYAVLIRDINLEMQRTDQEMLRNINSMNGLFLSSYGRRKHDVIEE